MSLWSDAKNIAQKDPAAKGVFEVIFLYAGFHALFWHRPAHFLYRHRWFTLARLISQVSRHFPGIEIHPGAKIGKNLFIDHGMGVVIGETCVIGNNVKLYQGVTLGAKSFPKDENGNPVKGIKRHPNIEDDVIIYAGATILGGDVTVGKGSVIGGNTWLTKSVPPHSFITNREG